MAEALMALAVSATVKRLFFLVDGRIGLALIADGGRLRIFFAYNAADGGYFCVGAILHILQDFLHDKCIDANRHVGWRGCGSVCSSDLLGAKASDDATFGSYRDNFCCIVGNTHGASCGALRLHGGGDTGVADEVHALATEALVARPSDLPHERSQTGAASALALGGRSVHKPHSRFQPPDPMPPALAAAGFEASVWADSRKFGKPAREIVRKLFKTANTTAEETRAVERAFALAKVSRAQAQRGVGREPGSLTASFGDARRVPVTVEGRGNARRFDLRLSSDCVALYRAATAAFALPPHSFRLLWHRKP